LKQYAHVQQLAASCGFKASETLLGIETITSFGCLLNIGFKASETLLGIETDRFWLFINNRI